MYIYVNICMYTLTYICIFMYIYTYIFRYMARGNTTGVSIQLICVTCTQFCVSA